MTSIQYHIIKPEDNEHISLIADWYLAEWNIPVRTTIEKIKHLSAERSEFQLLITLNAVPIATGGLYDHVSLLDKEPRLKIFKHWLALVYTTPENRGKGIGALLCQYIQERAKGFGLEHIYLFTHTAEQLYSRLGWQQIERLEWKDKNIVVMEKRLEED